MAFPVSEQTEIMVLPDGDDVVPTPSPTDGDDVIPTPSPTTTTATPAPILPSTTGTPCTFCFHRV